MSRPLSILFIVSFSVKTPGPVLCLYGNPNTGTAIVQLTTGEVLRILPSDSSEGCVLSPWLLDSGASLKYDEMVRCEKMELAVFNGKVLMLSCNTTESYSLPQERVIGLCESRCLLFIDDLKVISGCTSYAQHDEFLLLTTNTHICHFVPLNSDPKG
jgi:elongator complex protein 1